MAGQGWTRAGWQEPSRGRHFGQVSKFPLLGVLSLTVAVSSMHRKVGSIPQDRI